MVAGHAASIAENATRGRDAPFGALSTPSVGKIGLADEGAAQPETRDTLARKTLEGRQGATPARQQNGNVDFANETPREVREQRLPRMIRHARKAPRPAHVNGRRTCVGEKARDLQRLGLGHAAELIFTNTG